MSLKEKLANIIVREELDEAILDIARSVRNRGPFDHVSHMPPLQGPSVYERARKRMYNIIRRFLSEEELKEARTRTYEVEARTFVRMEPHHGVCRYFK